MRLLGLAFLLGSLAAGTACRADQTLILDLPSLKTDTPTAASAPKQAPKTGSAQAPSRSAARRPGQTLSRHAELRSGGKEKVVGRLGMASFPVGIHVGRSSRQRVLAKVASGTYLALTDEVGSWYGVLMADRTVGWIPKTSVKVLDYEVIAPNTPESRSYAGSAPNMANALLTTGQRSILETAYRYLGVRYKWGGVSPDGMDCSAFVQRCFSALGIQLPRTAHEQAERGMPVPTEQLQPADRLYFASRDGRITHTGIYLGNGYFIHASSSRGGVAVSRLAEPLYARMYCGARR